MVALDLGLTLIGKLPRTRPRRVSLKVARCTLTNTSKKQTKTVISERKCEGALLTVALAIKNAASADTARTSFTCFIIFLTLDMGNT